MIFTQENQEQKFLWSKISPTGITLVKSSLLSAWQADHPFRLVRAKLESVILYNGHVQNGTPNSKATFKQVLNKNIGFAFLLLTSPAQWPLYIFSVVIDSLQQMLSVELT